MFIIQHNDGRVHYTDLHAEARMYAWLSYHYCICNVYKQGAGAIPLCDFEI